MKLVRTFAALSLLVVVACGGPKKKPDQALIEADGTNENCCCRIETEDPDEPNFTRVAVMECSSRHGTCIQSELRCEGQPEPTPETTDPGSLPPTVEETPTSF